jgi:hypothetical protein
LACYSADGFTDFGGATLCAPALMWSESRSVWRELAWASLSGPESSDAGKADVGRRS